MQIVLVRCSINMGPGFRWVRLVNKNATEALKHNFSASVLQWQKNLKKKQPLPTYFLLRTTDGPDIIGESCHEVPCQHIGLRCGDHITVYIRVDTVAAV